MDEESSYINSNVTMPIKTKWRPFFKMAATDFCLFFVSVARHVGNLPQVTKYTLLWIGNVIVIVQT